MLSAIARFFLLAVFAALISSASRAQAPAPSVQFVQSASAVSFKDGVLTLAGASPSTIFFSDRPQRLSGHVRNDHFVKLWSEGKNSFASDPPNATLSTFAPDGRPRQAVLELSNPRLEGQSIAYNVRLLQGDLPAQGGQSALFIDGGNTPCNSGLDDPSYSGYPCWAQDAFSPRR